jgi:hypothetical protein
VGGAERDLGNGQQLWRSRHLTDGRIVVRRPSAPLADGPDWQWELRRQVQLRGRDWRRLERWQQWVIAVVVASVVAAPFASVSEDLRAVVALLVLGGFGALLYASRPGASWPTPAPPGPEAVLAASGTTEARVAAAACRAWAQTVREPSWQSPFLASSRAAFDGAAEVDRIVDLALRLHAARRNLGPRPAGPNGQYWDRQQRALEDAAVRLGRRADALIAYRDQAAALSVELRQLADLERLERSAVEIDGLTVETAYTSFSGDGGLGGVAAEIAGVRAAMTDLVDLMTRTRAPLAEPPASPPFG